MNVNKKFIVEELIKKHIISKKEAKIFVDAFFYELMNSLQNNEEIKISSFGNFTLRNKNPRIGRNPKTGKECIISARKTIQFKASKYLRNLIDSN